MLVSGTRLGSYEVIAPLGVGGMGEVFRARDMTLGREVALKILPNQFASDPDRIARFQREAQVLASLNHPQIAAIYGLQEADGIRALVLELVEGETLADRIARGSIPVDEALAIAGQIAEALEAAHEQGIIHRDLKPANIKVNPDGRVKVLDFGLAKLAEQPLANGSSPSSLSMSPTITTPAMTQMGMILGTAAYMSPEQAKGRPADKRSDVWAFGCVLYEMLSGKRAFEGEDVSDTLAAVLRGEPDWSLLPAPVPHSVKRLLNGTLRKNRNERVTDIAVAKFLLSNFDPSDERTQRPASKSTWIAVAVSAATIGVLGAAAAAVAIWPKQGSQIAKLVLPLQEGELLTGTARQQLDISPDGQRVVYSANNTLHVRELGNWEAQIISGTEDQLGVLNPTFSPDGRSVAFYANSDRTLKRIPISGGAAATLGKLSEIPFGMSWRDGWIWVGQGPRGIVRVPENGGTAEQIVTMNGGEVAHGPHLLADGEWLMFTVAKAGTSSTRWDEGKIVVQSLQSKERRTVIEGGSDGRVLKSGHLVYSVQGTVFAVPFAGATSPSGSRGLMGGGSCGWNPCEANHIRRAYSVSRVGSRRENHRRAIRTGRQGGDFSAAGGWHRCCQTYHYVGRYRVTHS